MIVDELRLSSTSRYKSTFLPFRSRGWAQALALLHGMPGFSMQVHNEVLATRRGWVAGVAGMMTRDGLDSRKFPT